MKKIYILPNLVTSANLFCGFFSVVQSIQMDFTLAAWSILAAGVFDMLDGRIARLAKATSPFGVQYDSLSDVVSFGVAPAVLMFSHYLQGFDRYGWAVAFLFLCCGALRLARFNVTTGGIKGYFQGLPIPGAAGAIVSFEIFQMTFSFFSEDTVSWVAFGLTLLASLLMVSPIPFPSFKEVNWRSRSGFGTMFSGIVALVFVVIRPQLAIFVIFHSYIFLSLLWAMLKWNHLKTLEVETGH
jgi:CDP-diacylglycerol---serine O-phosphatidyltransferase